MISVYDGILCATVRLNLIYDGYRLLTNMLPDFTHIAYGDVSHEPCLLQFYLSYPVSQQ
jgi:hypothetical protein